MKISLIISTYNWSKALLLCLDSVSKQTILPDEVIIADDGSNEDTQTLISKLKTEYKCPLIHIWHEDIGFRLSTIRNKAIAKASGDYIIQIDGDIILEKHFIQDHLSFAKSGFFVSGSRMMMSNELSSKLLKDETIRPSIFSKGVRNRFNGLRSKYLRNYYALRYRLDDPIYVKGCNMAFWRKDLLLVNGYNEDITGWGAEDSEIAARLIALGCKRRFLKFGAVQYHVYHKINSRERERINYDIILKNTLDSNIHYCKNGLDKYLNNI